MMVLVFGLMSLTLLAGWLAPARIAIACMLVSLAAALFLFLTDIHNRDYGFGLPWLQVEAFVAGARA